MTSHACVLRPERGAPCDWPPCFTTNTCQGNETWPSEPTTTEGTAMSTPIDPATETRWPYACDGVRSDDPANVHRVPLVTTAYPVWSYITAVVLGDLWNGVRPTDAELAVVASFHEYYLERWYGPADTGYRVRMARRPFDIDGGANGRLLVKRPDGTWAYRHRSWSQGATFWPTGPGFDSNLRLSLPDLLDRHEATAGRPSDRWDGWKAAHAEVFAALTPSQRLEA